MKTIPLTQGQVALVDDEDFARFGHLKWFAHWDPKAKRFYAHRNKFKDEPGPAIQILHRKIMGVTDPRVKVDHKNHDTLDCRRRTNLRACTNAQNMQNRSGLDAKNTSKMRGVSWHKKAGKWVAQICVKGERIYLGLFIDKIMAASVYAAANRKHFGEFGGNINGGER